MDNRGLTEPTDDALVARIANRYLNSYWEIQCRKAKTGDDEWSADPIGPNNQFGSEAEAEAALGSFIEADSPHDDEAYEYRLREVTR